jgi:telomerase reverse transcriptase
LRQLSAESDSVLSASSSGPLVTQPSVAQRGIQRELRPTSYTEGFGKGSGATKPKENLTDHATPAASVSAFCRAVIRSLIPLEFFGFGEQGLAHQKMILSHVDRFIRMRRFESLSLHEVCEGIKVSALPLTWYKY